ncbi:MAG TPA: hypothetical protein ENF26_04550 [Methanomicrobia archaeon]|nr:hypothetical protein [Methanomicrobia archaeon]HEX59400.1 hypothetical protein [Methanomicrobia archaeon]
MRRVPTPPMTIVGRAYGVGEGRKIVARVGGREAKILRGWRYGDAVSGDGDRFQVGILCPEDERCNDACDGKIVELYLEKDGKLVKKAIEQFVYRAFAVEFSDLHFYDVE